MGVTFKKILVPLDGSEESEWILPLVQDLAKGLDVPVLLISVIDPASIDLPEHFTDIYGRWEKHVHNRLTELVNDLEQGGVKADYLVPYGQPAEEILDAVRSHQCDLVAMATNGRGLIGWVALGSVTYSVINADLVPTVTITFNELQNWQHGRKVSKIIVPLDGSKVAETTLPYAERLARDLSLSLLLVRVAPTKGTVPAFLSGIPDEYFTQKEEEANEYLEKIAHALRAKGHTASHRVLAGETAPKILELTQEETESMVVITTHQRSVPATSVVGSTAIAVIQNSANPVVVIPPP